jgi:hypothetical protein
MFLHCLASLPVPTCPNCSQRSRPNELAPVGPLTFVALSTPSCAADWKAKLDT